MKVSAVREMSTDELYRALDEERRSLMSLRFQKVTRQLTDTNQMRMTRRTIARILQVIRERQIVEELGLVAD